MKQFILYGLGAFSLMFGLSSCGKKNQVTTFSLDTVRVSPVIVTESVVHDTDDPAIWINPADSTHVLIIGTDKGGELGDGGLYAFDLSGKIINSVRPLRRPNNVDVAYALTLNGKPTDIAVCTERMAQSIRVFRLPDLEPVDNGGITVFDGEPDTLKDPMGVALYTSPFDNKIYAIVGRKSGPKDGTYLWQYLLTDDGTGNVKGMLVRKFGYYSGKKEIESIAVDNELGYVYHSDEGHGIHKSYAHPDSSNVELALFGTTGFTEDIEGISIYKFKDGTGYILVSDQQANQFRVFPREGLTNPHIHPEVAVIKTSTSESDGSDVTSRSLPGFPNGLFVAMSDDKTFQYYRWEDLAGKQLRKINK
ncbi:MAG: phytase [Cyclobacteriaceae bacterium]|nr:phytase [Cyclobacteriaceae bacterium]